MASNLSIGKDINGAIDDSIAVSENLYAATLAANTPTSIVVPPNVDVVYFSFGSSGDVWVDMQNTASVPASMFVKTTSELNPVSRAVTPGKTISFLCLFANPVQISFYNTRNI